MIEMSHVTVMVRDQEEALKYYTEILGFVKKQDQTVEDFRWLVVGPENDNTGLVLVLAETDEEKTKVGNQTGGRYPLLVVTTTSCQKTYEKLKEKGVEFVSGPMEHPWGVAVQFNDLYGNLFELVQLTSTST